MNLREAPEWQVQEWLNVDRPIALANLRALGRRVRACEARVSATLRDRTGGDDTR